MPLPLIDGSHQNKIMNRDTLQVPYLLRPVSVYLLTGLVIVNSVALFSFNPFYIGSFLSFLYIVTTPGFLALSVLAQKKFSPMLGTALSVALSTLILMIVGLALNTILPILGVSKPLTTIPLLMAFDVVVYILLLLDYKYGKDSAFEFHGLNFFDRLLVGMTLLIPVCGGLGAIVLNNGGRGFLTMCSLALVIPVMFMVVLKEKVSPVLPPLSLYMIALAFLLMNSLRGWFVTGHDILLEYHVFRLTNEHHLWSMSFYQDAYNACLSLTIFPVYLQQLMYISSEYVFKFFTQFITALSVVVIYYLAKNFTTEKVAFLIGFLYISFPTFMVDMAFLNRQGIALLFFSALVFVIFDSVHFSKNTRSVALLAFGAGMILSHYSTSYIAIPILIGAYVISTIARWIMTREKVCQLFSYTIQPGNLEIYRKPVLLTLPFVLTLSGMLFFWSAIVTKTSDNFSRTLQQIIITIERPFDFAGNAGPAKYSLAHAKMVTSDELLAKFVKDGFKERIVQQDQSDFYPIELTSKYSTIALQEPQSELTILGRGIQSVLPISLGALFAQIKLAYAKILQILLLVGLAGLALGYGFKRYLQSHVPIEYLAISISGIGIMVAQTILPGSAVDYGLLRLFQQNLIILSLPIVLGFLSLFALFTRRHKVQILLCTAVLLSFFIVLSGFLPQTLGGGRPLLSLNNSGLYYDLYYTHAHELTSLKWLAKNATPHVPVQSDRYFSNIKMLSYVNIAPQPGLLPETLKKHSYVYLNFLNFKKSNVIEYVDGDIVYYHFPVSLLNDNKDLIYSNGGSAIYR